VGISGRSLFLLVTLALTSPVVAQVQVNQTFLPQGPAPSFGPTATVQSGDAPPNGNVTGAIETVIADPSNANGLFVATPNGGIWETTNAGASWTALTDHQATLSIASLAFDPTDPNHNCRHGPDVQRHGVRARGRSLLLQGIGRHPERNSVLERRRHDLVIAWCGHACRADRGCRRGGGKYVARRHLPAVLCSHGPPDRRALS
jgi:hypothetical protein